MWLHRGMMTIRNIPDVVHNALKARAKRHNSSAEAEVSAILEEITWPDTRHYMGDALTALSRKVGLTKESIEPLDESL